MIPSAQPSKARIVRHVGRCLLALAFATITCSAADQSAACWPRDTFVHDEEDGSGCVPEPAGQACDETTQRCESVCDPSEYLLVCRGAASVSSPLATGRSVREPPAVEALPTPGAGLKCGPVRVSLAAVPNQTLYCCRCAG